MNEDNATIILEVFGPVRGCQNDLEEYFKEVNSFVVKINDMEEGYRVLVKGIDNADHFSQTIQNRIPESLSGLMSYGFEVRYLVGECVRLGLCGADCSSHKRDPSCIVSPYQSNCSVSVSGVRNINDLVFPKNVVVEQADVLGEFIFSFKLKSAALSFIKEINEQHDDKHAVPYGNVIFGSSYDSKVPRGPKGANLFVFYVPNSWDRHVMYNRFSKFGLVISCTIVRDGPNKRSLGYGFVSMSQPYAAILAIERLNGLTISGKKLKVSLKKGDEPCMGECYVDEPAISFKNMHSSPNLQTPSSYSGGNPLNRSSQSFSHKEFSRTVSTEVSNIFAKSAGSSFSSYNELLQQDLTSVGNPEKGLHSIPVPCDTKNPDMSSFVVYPTLNPEKPNQYWMAKINWELVTINPDSD